VEGHADATGSTQHNEALSLRRAEAVRTHLVELGVNPDWLAARGAGSRVPLIADRPDAPENRRVEFRRED
jgi:outer membrane protein OmpA-like peptidoglycan-associated protein